MSDNIAALIERISPEVRKESPYLVRNYPKIDVKVNQNENPFSIPESIKSKILSSIAELDWNRYPDSFGDELRAQIAEQHNLSIGSVLLGNGSNELVYLIGQCLIPSGSTVLLPAPMFSLYEKVIRLRNAEIVNLPCDENFDLIKEEAVRLIDEHDPSLVILTSPNNPTGRSIPISAIKEILQVSKGFVLLDEAYFEFLEGADGLSLLAEHPNLIVLRTFSKVLGLAGIRLGHIMGHEDVFSEFFKLRLPFMIDRITATIGKAILQETELVREQLSILKHQRNLLFEELSDFENLSCIKSEANFLIFQTPLDSSELVQRLADLGVLIRDMSGYPELQNYVRVSVGTEVENKIFLKALTQSV